MSQPRTLISHALCPYVQRAVIALTEKGVACERVYVDLAHKPGWFQALSPLGKTPVLKVGNTAIFESAVILEYLEETEPRPMHPADPLRRAEHRALIEYGSAVLNDISDFTPRPMRQPSAPGGLSLNAGLAGSRPACWRRHGSTVTVSRSLMPCSARSFVISTSLMPSQDFGILAGKPKLARWRAALAARPSVRDAVGADYAGRLWRFLEGRNGHLSRLMAAEGCSAADRPT